MNGSAPRPLLALLAYLTIAFGFATTAYGHALQPGYLELRLLDDELYAAVWKKR